jgi:release factor glutamine methyltransferase
VLDELCGAAPGALRPGGVLLVVHSALCGTGRTVEMLRAGGLTAQVVDREIVPYGPVMRRYAPWLEARGLAEPGVHKEELVVIRAERA